MNDKHETINFKSHDGKAIFTVKKRFIEKCPEYLELDSYDLCVIHKLKDYLHNLSGPAIYYIDSKRCEYFILGKQLVGGDKEEMHYRCKFQNNLMGMIDSIE